MAETMEFDAEGSRRQWDSIHRIEEEAKELVHKITENACADIANEAIAIETIKRIVKQETSKLEGLVIALNSKRAMQAKKLRDLEDCILVEPVHPFSSGVLNFARERIQKERADEKNINT